MQKFEVGAKLYISKNFEVLPTKQPLLEFWEPCNPENFPEYVE